MHGLHFAPQKMARGRSLTGQRQIEGMPQLLALGQHFLAALKGLVGIAQPPQSVRTITETKDLGVNTLESELGPVLKGVIQRQALLRVLVRSGKFSYQEHGLCLHCMRMGEPHGIRHALRPTQKLLG